MTTADGKVEKWQCEGGAPNMLKRNGWSRSSLNEGDTITINGSRAKDGTNTCEKSSSGFPPSRSILWARAEALLHQRAWAA